MRDDDRSVALPGVHALLSYGDLVYLFGFGDTYWAQ
jgi:hypothetical protein